MDNLYNLFFIFLPPPVVVAMPFHANYKTIRDIVGTKQNSNNSNRKEAEIYKIHCTKSYIGETSRNLKKGYMSIADIIHITTL